MDKILVQIASYRDPELIPTIKDLFDKAKRPEDIVLSVIDQYNPDDTFSDLSEVRDKITHLERIPHLESKGVCWVRSKLGQTYSDEKYTLMLDSHHRFVKNWDAKLINMYKRAESDNPIITSYLPSYNPQNDPKERTKEPWQLQFDRFIPEGAVFTLPCSIPDWKSVKKPVLGRFFSGHFAFSKGEICKEVKYDPNYYFHGEEINMAVRAWTHGYDLFYPHRIIGWHEYTRKGRTKHWDESPTWHVLNDESHKRNRILFGMGEEGHIDFGEYGFGTKRTLAEYEEFAGIRFSDTFVQSHTISNKIPPAPPNTEWAPRFRHCIDINANTFKEDDYDFWCVVLKDADGNDLFREDADEAAVKKLLGADDGWVRLWRECSTVVHPKRWTVWPHSKTKGWCDIIEGRI